MRSVFKKIGGKAAVDAAVERFYDYMLADDRVKDFFDGVNMEKQRQHQKNTAQSQRHQNPFQLWKDRVIRLPDMVS